MMKERGKKKTGRAEMESVNVGKNQGTKTRGNKAKDYVSGCRRKAGGRGQLGQGANLGAWGEKAERKWGQALFGSTPSSVPYCMNLGASYLISALQNPQKEERHSKNTPTVNMMCFSRVLFFL